MNITQSGEFESKSTWAPPETGSPVFVHDGVLTKAHFNGMPYVQLWAKGSAFCDHVVSSNMNVLAGSYWNPTKREPIVVRSLSSVPTIPDGSKPGGLAVWPEPGFQLKNLQGKEVTIYGEGHFQSELFNMTDCVDTYLTVYLRGSAGFFWKIKGLGTVERGSGNSVEVVSGLSRSATVVRCIGSAYPAVRVHSGVEVMFENADSGRVYVTPRHKLNNVTKWSACGGSIECSTGGAYSPVEAMLTAFKLPFFHADVMLDDWWSGAAVQASSAYVCGAGNDVRAGVIYLDERKGWTNWPDAPNRHIGQNVLTGTVYTLPGVS